MCESQTCAHNNWKYCNKYWNEFFTPRGSDNFGIKRLVKLENGDYIPDNQNLKEQKNQVENEKHDVFKKIQNISNSVSKLSLRSTPSNNIKSGNQNIDFDIFQKKKENVDEFEINPNFRFRGKLYDSKVVNRVLVKHSQWFVTEHVRLELHNQIWKKMFFEIWNTLGFAIFGFTSAAVKTRIFECLTTRQNTNRFFKIYFVLLILLLSLWVPTLELLNSFELEILNYSGELLFLMISVLLGSNILIFVSFIFYVGTVFSSYSLCHTIAWTIPCFSKEIQKPIFISPIFQTDTSFGGIEWHLTVRQDRHKDMFQTRFGITAAHFPQDLVAMDLQVSFKVSDHIRDFNWDPVTIQISENQMTAGIQGRLKNSKFDQNIVPCQNGITNTEAAESASIVVFTRGSPQTDALYIECHIKKVRYFPKNLMIFQFPQLLKFLRIVPHRHHQLHRHFHKQKDCGCGSYFLNSGSGSTSITNPSNRNRRIGTRIGQISYLYFNLSGHRMSVLNLDSSDNFARSKILKGSSIVDFLEDPGTSSFTWTITQFQSLLSQDQNPNDDVANEGVGAKCQFSSPRIICVPTATSTSTEGAVNRGCVESAWYLEICERDGVFTLNAEFASATAEATDDSAMKTGTKSKIEFTGYNLYEVKYCTSTSLGADAGSRKWRNGNNELTIRPEEFQDKEPTFKIMKCHETLQIFLFTRQSILKYFEPIAIQKIKQDTISPFNERSLSFSLCTESECQLPVSAGHRQGQSQAQVHGQGQGPRSQLGRNISMGIELNKECKSEPEFPSYSLNIHFSVAVRKI